MQAEHHEMRALLSIHDVMPETLERVEAILDFCARQGIPPLTLLVVPGRDWQPAALARLHELAERGHTLAAHGWHHRIPRFGGLYHRLHAAVISRNVAEHLALDPEDVLALMQRSHQWFIDHGLPAPSLYVPPAWALGRLPADGLERLPYRQIEVTRGLLEVATGRLHPLPLVGFEADTPTRALALRTFNAVQRRRARHGRRPLRIGIHPDDFQLGLADSLERLLQSPLEFIPYRAAI